MRGLLLIAVICVCFSCKNFELKKTSVDAILDEEMKAMDWSSVDTYPTFETCQDYTENARLKACFQKTLSSQLHQRLPIDLMQTTNELKDTLRLTLSISEAGKPVMKALNFSPRISKDLPDIETQLQNVLDSLPKIYPAYKRGIPVAVTLQVPIIIKPKE